MNLKEAIDEFILACKADLLKEKTIRWYESILSGWLDNFEEEVMIDEISTKDMREYIVYLREKDTLYDDAIQKPTQEGGMSKATIRSHVTALKRFWSWATIEYGLSHDIMKRIRKPSKLDMHTKAISWETYVAMFKILHDDYDIFDIRDRAIMAMLGDTGIRSEGLCELKPKHLNLKEGYAIVLEKGSKRRKVPMTKTCVLYVGW